MLDDDQCYRAVHSRDERFDGWFVTAVRSTGIYCRPSCPAMTPKRANVEFYPTAAAAQQHGYRSCKRCRPDATPGSPEWDTRADVVGRAMRLIADGYVDRCGVSGLAARLGYSQRQLLRIVTDEVGAGPLALARAQRAHTARTLIETTQMPVTEIAFAAGFSSVRQFNDSVRAVYAASPSELRQRRRSVSGTGEVTLRLAVRRPFPARLVLGFLGKRAIAGLESWDGTAYRRALRLPGGTGIVRLSIDTDDSIRCTLRLDDISDLAAASYRCRRLLDLDADPVAIDAALGRDPVLGELVRQRPGMRSPGAVDPQEMVTRGILGQQVTIEAARTLGTRLVARWGQPLRQPWDDVTLCFPQPADLAAELGTAEIGLTRQRRAALVGANRAMAEGTVELDVGADRQATRRALLALRGVGPWTADYVMMRGLGDPDVLLGGDVGVRHGLSHLGVGTTIDDRPWRPWRSYATHHLWALSAEQVAAAPRKDT